MLAGFFWSKVMLINQNFLTINKDLRDKIAAKTEIIGVTQRSQYFPHFFKLYFWSTQETFREESVWAAVKLVLMLPVITPWHFNSSPGWVQQPSWKLQWALQLMGCYMGAHISSLHVWHYGFLSHWRVHTFVGG